MSNEWLALIAWAATMLAAGGAAFGGVKIGLNGLRRSVDDLKRDVLRIADRQGKVELQTVENKTKIEVLEGRVERAGG